MSGGTTTEVSLEISDSIYKKVKNIDAEENSMIKILCFLFISNVMITMIILLGVYP